jgi:uncharacterized repeat protein (TIGR01451 family)
MLNLNLKKISKKFRAFSKYPITNLSILVMMASLALFGIVQFNRTDIQIASADGPKEPSCQTVATSPTWNPFPINNGSPSPLYNTGGNCQDIPMLSFFPIDTGAGNPREITILRNQDISFHFYYNNGATPGSQAITNPVAAMQVIKESETRYRVTGTLSGSNAQTVTSAQKGGDLILNVPSGTKLKILGDSTRHYPKAVQRRYEADTTGKRPYDMIPDNSTGSVNSNPLFTKFDGVNLPSSSGFLISSSGLEPGFLNYGYILTKIVADVQPLDENKPPVIPGEEITIIRGESGSFKALVPTDPDNNYPISLDLTKVPSFCSVTGQPNSQGGGQIITCKTDANTPVRTEFIITPTDSKGLVGQPGTFIVNIIEPGLSLTKNCFVKRTQKPCKESALASGDDITYKITARNTSNVVLKNLTIVDDYDQQRISDITNISDEGELVPSQGKIFWNALGNLNANQSKEVNFDAKVSPNAKPGDKIENIATANAQGVDPVNATYDFNIPSKSQIDGTLVKTCAKENGEACKTGVVPGQSVRYSITFTNTSQEIAKNVKIVDQYDAERLTNIRDLNPNGEISASQPTITWQLGDVPAGQSKTVSFRASTKPNLTHGTIIDNIAIVTADNLPEKRANTDFLIQIPPAPITPRTGGGTAILLVLISIALASAGYYYYRKNNAKLASGFIPNRTKEDVQTKTKNKHIKVPRKKS